MFAQVIHGRVNDADAVEQQAEVWDRDIRPGAAGFLGATSGVADDGEFIAVVRFESAEAAQANSDRPEQGEWWAATEGLFDGEAMFHNCEQVDTFLDGGSDDAGFVQVITGRSEREKLREIGLAADEHLRRIRPDVIGGSIAWHDDDPGMFTQLVYFTSEEAARHGESVEASPEDEAIRASLMNAIEGVRFVDLRRLWFSSP